MPDHGVRFHDLPFFRGMFARLVQHMIGDADLADVMKRGSVLQHLGFTLGHAMGASDQGGHQRHAPDMIGGLPGPAFNGAPQAIGDFALGFLDRFLQLQVLEANADVARENVEQLSI